MSSPFLPPLTDKARVSPGTPGKWEHQQNIAYSEVAESLARPEVGTDSKSISSIPDMWARPLLVDMVLRDSDHPLHKSIKAQWKGMLAAIALAEVQSFKLKAELLDLKQLQSNSFIGALLDLLPPPQKSAYQLEQNNKNPWEKIYVFLLNDKPVGMTSPTTLVCPAEKGDWQGVSWYEDGTLKSPLSPVDHLTEDDKSQLWLWLDNLRRQLNKQEGDSTKLKEIITEYQNELKAPLSLELATQTFRLSDNERYFGETLSLGKLTALNTPIQQKKIESSVKLLPLGRILGQDVFFLPNIEQLREQWPDKQAKYIWIYDTNIITFNLEEFKRKYRGKVKYLTENDIFAADFYFLEGEGNLPGALLPENIDNLKYTIDQQDHTLTPLLPLKAEILNYLSPTELIKRLEIRPSTIGSESGVRVKLKLPLSGGDYTIQRDYPIKQTNALTAKPFLEIWPNFQATNWQAYYTFYFDDRTEATKQNKTFRAIFPGAKEIHPLELKNFQITRLESFPDYLICQDEIGVNQGLILLKTPPTVGDQNPNKTWIVGVDFGTSFTNIYYQINRFSTALNLSPLNLQVTAQDSRMVLLYKYFMSANPLKFPVSSVLTTESGNAQERPVFDGRLYIPQDIRTFDPNQDYIKTELKWEPENLPYTRTFLKHLSLLISAEAAQNNVRKIEWSISYPSAFSRTDKNLYKVTWQKIIDNLNDTTGIEHKWLAKGTPYRSESLALAYYFADEEEKDLVYTTCIDMGGGTSDISIWVGNRLIHQCSVQLAGRLLFSQFLKHKPDFLNQQFNVDLLDLSSNLRDEPFFVKLDGILAAEGNKWLEKNRALMDDNNDLQDIVQLASLGIAGLYYYIGLVLQALDLEGLYNRKQNTPVYIGGNGCRILNWLDLSGTFTPECDAAILFSHILSKGSGFEDSKQDTILSSNPKSEVACGLVLDQNKTRLTVLQQEDDDLFAGENCFVNGQPIEWRDRLNLLKFGEIETFKVKTSDFEEEDSSLVNLKQFVDDFQQTFQEKRIVSIKPLENYDDEEWRQKLWNDVSRRVEAELTNMTGHKAEDVRVEPPFIIGLKALLKELSERM